MSQKSVSRTHGKIPASAPGRDSSTRSPAAVAILGLNYFPEPTGIAPYTAGLAVGLTEMGFSVNALVAHPHYPGWCIKKGYGQWSTEERIKNVKVRRHRHYVPRSPRGVRRLLSELSFGLRLVCARWGAPATVIAVSPSLFASAMATLRLRFVRRRPKLVIWVQDIYTLGLSETGEGGGLVGRLTRTVESSTLKAADRVVVIHRRFADYVVKELGVDPTRVAVIRNWTHLQDEAPVSADVARVSLGWPVGVTLAVHTGNMGVKQGLENVVDAARIADSRGAQVHFILVGGGGERNSLMERAHGVKRLTFVDPLTDSDYLSALSAADVLLVNEKPGVSAMAVPSKLTSYFHAGKPIVAATDLQGITASELEASKAGVVISAGDPEALLEAVLEVTSSSETAREFGRNGQRYRTAALSEENALKNWSQLLQSLAG